MDINFEYHGVAASERLEEIAESKLNKLSEKFAIMVNSDVYFKKENTSEHDTGMICGFRINTVGPTLFSESSKASFEAAISEASNEMRRQLQKQKDKMKSH